MCGEFSKSGLLAYRHRTRFRLPAAMPGFLLNRLSVGLFNNVLYHKNRNVPQHTLVGIDQFFYPLDRIDRWNRMYGRSGFLQYQFILPMESSFQGLTEILQLIAQSGKASFLAVLKLYGEQNANWLSFPMRGYSLALDFKFDQTVLQLLDRLDERMRHYGGRIYLAKDARAQAHTIALGYPHLRRFQEYRRHHGMDRVFNSAQSTRLGI